MSPEVTVIYSDEPSTCRKTSSSLQFVVVSENWTSDRHDSSLVAFYESLVGRWRHICCMQMKNGVLNRTESNIGAGVLGDVMCLRLGVRRLREVCPRNVEI